MKIAIISDIHSNLEALNAVLRDIGEVTSIYCVGDLVGYGPDPNKVIEILEALGVKAVMGNHDFATIHNAPVGFNEFAAAAIYWSNRTISTENMKLLASLPEHLSITYDNLSLHLVHGSPRDPLNEYITPNIPDELLLQFLRQTKADILIMGHTHLPFYADFKGQGEGIVLNPGSVGQPRDHDPRASYCIIGYEDEKIDVEIKRVDYDIEKVSEKIKRAGLPEFLAERLFHGY
ncbi:MAG: metallophosphoesterase family protein [Promethearchaeota archaeon]